MNSRSRSDTTIGPGAGHRAFFVGKGDVGKTSLASATALALSDVG